jgi:hypothetical protein
MAQGAMNIVARFAVAMATAQGAMNRDMQQEQLNVSSRMVSNVHWDETPHNG